MYTARKTNTWSISIDWNWENFNYNLKIPWMTIDEINELLKSYDGKDPVAYLKSKETEMYDELSDFDGEESGEVKLVVEQQDNRWIRLLFTVEWIEYTVLREFYYNTISFLIWDDRLFTFSADFLSNEADKFNNFFLCVFKESLWNLNKETLKKKIQEKYNKDYSFFVNSIWKKIEEDTFR